MYIREDAQETIARNQTFHRRKTPGTALCLVRSVKALQSAPMKPLNAWDMDNDWRAYLDAWLEYQLGYFERRAKLADDLLPAISPWYGIAELTAYCGGAVAFEKTTSFHLQTIDDIENPPDGLFPSDSAWHRLVLDGMAHLRERLQGRLYVKLRGAACPIDIVNALRGNDLFSDVYDAPEAVHGLMARAAEALAAWMEKQYDRADHVGGGVISGFETWLPGRRFGHLSEDATVMCSPAQYREFARPYTERALAGFEGAFIHTHSGGAHAIPDIAAVQKFGLMEISSDPNAPRAVRLFAEMEEALRGKTVILAVTPKEIAENLPLLERNHTILWMDVETLSEAEDALRYVRRVLPAEKPPVS